MKPAAITWKTWGLAALHAVLFALAFPPFDLWPLIFFAPAPLAWAAIHTQSTRNLLLIVLITQMLMWLWLTRFTAVLTPVGWPFFCLVMSLYPIAFTGIMRWLSSKRLRLPMSVAVPVVWVALEFVRGEILFNGYPWYMLAHPLIEWLTFAQSADLLGQYFVGFLAAIVSGALIDILLAVRQAPRPLARVAGMTIGIVAVLAANVGYGSWRMKQESNLRPGPRVLAIQTNLPQDLKMTWKPQDQIDAYIDFQRQTLEAFDQTIAQHGENSIDLIVWPETMLPGLGLEPPEIEFLLNQKLFPGDVFMRGIMDLRNALNVPFLVGSPAWIGVRVEKEFLRGDRKYNSAYLIEGDPPFKRYDKLVLTPFGETMPYISNWDWLEEQLLALGAPGMSFDLDQGAEIVRFPINFRAPNATASAVAATPICFEDTVGWLNRRMVYEGGRKISDLLINLSNDAWFTFSHADRKLHAQTARYRCIETRVPMARSVNSGCTIILDSCGRIIARAGSGNYGSAEQPGSAYATLMLDSRGSLYGRVGDLWGWIMLAGAAGLLVLGRTAPKDHGSNSHLRQSAQN